MLICHVGISFAQEGKVGGRANGTQREIFAG